MSEFTKEEIENIKDGINELISIGSCDSTWNKDIKALKQKIKLMIDNYKETMLENNLQELIKDAIKIKELHKWSYVTIWKTENSISFNFDEKPVGYEMEDYGIKRKVIGVY